MELPKRVFNSPLIEYANFKDGNHVNLIRLRKPYSNGVCYAVHNTTVNQFAGSGLFKSYKQAKTRFELIARTTDEQLIGKGVTGNENN